MTAPQLLQNGGLKTVFSAFVGKFCHLSANLLVFVIFTHPSPPPPKEVIAYVSNFKFKEQLNPKIDRIANIFLS